MAVITTYSALLRKQTAQLQEFGYVAQPEPAPDEYTTGEVIGDYFSDMLDGANHAVAETGTSLLELNPFRLLDDASAYGDTLARYAGGVGSLASGIVKDPLGAADDLLFAGNFGHHQYGRGVGEFVGGMAAGVWLNRWGRLLPEAGRGVVAARTATIVDRLPHPHPATKSVVTETVQRATVHQRRFLGHDGEEFTNKPRPGEMSLPTERPGYYTEWTVAANGEKRGARRLVFGGDPADPDVIYYTENHYETYVKVYP